MPRRMYSLLAAATLSGAVALAGAQTPDATGPASSPSQNYTQQQSAPVERLQDGQTRTWNGPVVPRSAPPANSAVSQPIPGVMLRVGPNGSVSEVAKDNQRLELRVDRGVANVNVHDPAKDTLILVDLPGGQTQVLKNGLYTFNAETNTVRVLKGEAKTFPADNTAKNDKPVKIKENHKVVFGGDRVRSEEFMPQEARADIIPGSGGNAIIAQREAYGWGPYGDGFYGYPAYPYYAYGYPYGWGWGNPYAFYPYPMGFSLGFGYVGGFHHGGYHGGYHGGFHGHGRR